MRTKGKITSWNDVKGFGFITPNGGEKQIFVHITAFNNRTRRPEVNQWVTYALSADKHGRPRAAEAILADSEVSQKPKQNISLPVVGSLLYLSMVGVSVLTSKIHPVILALYMATSILTYLLYAVDKSSARKGTWRTPENTLHLLSLAGGWPGALVAQQTLRHKTKKQPFRLIFWVTVLLNGGVFVGLFTPTGTATLQLLIDRMA